MKIQAPFILPESLQKKKQGCPTHTGNSVLYKYEKAIIKAKLMNALISISLLAI